MISYLRWQDREILRENFNDNIKDVNKVCDEFIALNGGIEELTRKINESVYKKVYEEAISRCLDPNLRINDIKKLLIFNYLDSIYNNAEEIPYNLLGLGNYRFGGLFDKYFDIFTKNNFYNGNIVNKIESIIEELSSKLSIEEMFSDEINETINIMKDKLLKYAEERIEYYQDYKERFLKLYEQESSKFNESYDMYDFMEEYDFDCDDEVCDDYIRACENLKENIDDYLSMIILDTLEYRVSRMSDTLHKGKRGILAYEYYVYLSERTN